MIFRLSRPVSCNKQENGSGKQRSLHAPLKGSILVMGKWSLNASAHHLGSYYIYVHVCQDLYCPWPGKLSFDIPSFAMQYQLETFSRSNGSSSGVRRRKAYNCTGCSPGYYRYFYTHPPTPQSAGKNYCTVRT